MTTNNSRDRANSRSKRKNGGVRSTLHRLLGSGTLRGRIDRHGWRWITMSSVRRYQHHQRLRGPTGRPRKSALQTSLQLVEG